MSPTRLVLARGLGTLSILLPVACCAQVVARRGEPEEDYGIVIYPSGLDRPAVRVDVDRPHGYSDGGRE